MAEELSVMWGPVLQALKDIPYIIEETLVPVLGNDPLDNMTNDGRITGAKAVETADKMLAQLNKYKHRPEVIALRKYREYALPHSRPVC